MGTISMQIPEELLIDALMQLPYKKRLEIWRKVHEVTKIELRCLKAEKLDKITGLVSLGGDAVRDSEKVFDLS